MGFLIQQQDDGRWKCPWQVPLTDVFASEAEAQKAIDNVIRINPKSFKPDMLRIVTEDGEVPLSAINEAIQAMEVATTSTIGALANELESQLCKILKIEHTPGAIKVQTLILDAGVLIDKLRLDIAKRDALLADLGIPFEELDDIYQHADELAKGAAASPLGAALDKESAAMYGELMKIADEVKILAGDPTAIKPKPSVEVQDSPEHARFRFRLVAKDGRASGWTNYEGVAFLDGWATATDFYLADGTTFPILTADEMLKFIAVCEEVAK